MPILNFKGKSTVYSHHLGVPFQTLEMDKKKSFPKKSKNGALLKPSLNDNLIIHGDNLYALKALMPEYAGSIKCIYIDPPYNTGNKSWQYNDNASGPLIKNWLGKTVGDHDLERHDKWLCMMWPRLKLLRDLLSDNGVIFVSIDDHEQHHLQMIMDEIFGEKNFIAQFIWKRKRKSSYLHKNLGVITEYVKCYSKNRDLTLPLSIETSPDIQAYPFYNTGNRLSILEFPKNSVSFCCSDQILPPQDMSKEGKHVKLLNKLVIKNGKNKSSFRLEGCWRFSQRKLNSIVSNKDKILISKIPFKPRWIKKGGEAKPMSNLLTQASYNIPTNEDATEELSNIFFAQPLTSFHYPKPSGLIKTLIKSVTYNDKEAIILDSFAGSGTTAQAVLELNKEDHGNRKFILIECEKYADKITAERVRRVIKGVPKAKNEKLKKGFGGSFTYYTLGKEIKKFNKKNTPSQL